MIFIPFYQFLTSFYHLYMLPSFVLFDNLLLVHLQGAMFGGVFHVIPAKIHRLEAVNNNIRKIAKGRKEEL